MERMGFVARIEEDLERTISLGRLPKDGSLPSENLLARHYGVSRTTVREALLRLAARGLVVQRPGRKSRAVAMDEAVTLENLSVALHAEGPAHPERRRLLEGYLALKREMTVELLAACCEHATEADLEALRDACFQLREEARWKESSGWVEREFNLLRLAALVANRPGHFLLIQSLERSFWGMATRLLPHLDGGAICRWAECVFYALYDKDAQALRRKLTPLLQAGDERLLRGCSPAPKEAEAPEDLHRPEELLPEPHSKREAARLESSSADSFRELQSKPEATRDQPLPADPFRASHTEPEAARGEPSPVEQVRESHTEHEAVRGEPLSVGQVRESHTEPEAARGESSPVEQVRKSHTKPEAARGEPSSVEQVREFHTELEAAKGELSPAEQFRESRTEPEAATGELSAEVCANLSACWTGSDEMPPTGAPPPESRSSGFGRPLSDTALGREGPPVREEEGEACTGASARWPLAPRGPDPAR